MLTLQERSELADWTHYHSGWLYGMWYVGTSWQKNRLYGQFPGKFWSRFRALFPDVADSRLLHLCSGTVSTPEIRVDLSRRFAPSIQADVHALPLINARFDLVFIDPPYSQDDARRYGFPMINRKRVMAEANRVLIHGGLLAWLDVRYPSYRRADWRLCGLIGIVTGFLRATRVVSIFEKR